MIILKRFSATKILNTNSAGFIRGRKYDTDLDRLGRLSTQRELHSKVGDLRKEMKNLSSELEEGRKGRWQDSIE